jgi:hypothetical protein
MRHDANRAVETLSAARRSENIDEATAIPFHRDADARVLLR